MFIEHARQSRKSLRNAIKKACSLPAANILGPDVAVINIVDSDDEPLVNLLHGAVGALDFRCNDCGKTFTSHQKRSVHQASRFTSCTNPLLALRKKLGASGKCLACEVQFDNRGRLLEHLAEKNPVCRAYFMQMDDVPADLWNTLEEEARALGKHNTKRGLRRTRADAPAFRLSGPSPYLGLDHSFRHPLGRDRGYMA